MFCEKIKFELNEFFFKITFKYFHESLQDKCYFFIFKYSVQIWTLLK